MKRIFQTILFILLTKALYAQCVPAYGYPTKKVEVGSLKINYVEKGEGTAFLLIHGLGGNASHWKRNIESLSAHYRCIAIDLPGYGNSQSDENIASTQQLDFYVEVIAALLKKLQIHQTIVMGHSMGGQISILLALQHPLLVSKLILVSPAGLETFSDTEANLMKMYATPDFYQNQDNATIEKNYRSNFYQMPEEASVLAKERIALRNCNAFINYCKQITKGVQGMLGHPVHALLKSIRQPTLVLFGLEDALIPNKLLHPYLTIVQVAEEAKKIPNVTVNMIASAGHLLPFEKPDEVNKAVLQFLSL